MRRGRCEWQRRARWCRAPCARAPVNHIAGNITNVVATRLVAHNPLRVEKSGLPVSLVSQPSEYISQRLNKRSIPKDLLAGRQGDGLAVLRRPSGFFARLLILSDCDTARDLRFSAVSAGLRLFSPFASVVTLDMTRRGGQPDYRRGAPSRGPEHRSSRETPNRRPGRSVNNGYIQ